MNYWIHNARYGLAFIAVVLLSSSLGMLSHISQTEEDNVIQVGPNLQYVLQTRLIDAIPGDVIELGEGVFSFHSELNVVCDNLTIRGQGSDKTILSFKGQQAGSEGLTATGNGFVVENLAIEDTAGDAIKVLGADGVVFRGVRVEWTNGPSSLNGAYGLYPVECKNVLIEDCVAIGASDAGIYVGQSKNVIVRDSRAEYNVAGIEIENTRNADVYDCIATNNTGGLLVFDLPGLPAGNGGGVRLFNNTVVHNNTPNFAPEGNIVGTVPTGTGIMIMATDDVEVFGNTIRNNDTVNISVVSYLVTERKFKDPSYDPYPEGVHIYGNSMSEGGSNPGGKFGLLLGQLLPVPLPDILYDGLTNPAREVDGGIPEEFSLKINESPEVRFANFDAANMSMKKILRGKHSPSFDIDAHKGSHPLRAKVELEKMPDPKDGNSIASEIYRTVPKTLSGWDLFKGDGSTQTPKSGVLPYTVNTPLFSDHASKYRFIRLPEGSPMEYMEDAVLEFPDGSVIVKTFSYPNDMRDSSRGERLVETRIEYRDQGDWYGFSYQWNDDQTEAELVLGGASVTTAWIDGAGESVAHQYEIPNANQCITCHAQDGDYEPLGPTARNLNLSYDHGQGEVNQLEDWVSQGLLAHAPAHHSIPILPVWNDEGTGDLDSRARAWLEVNCAHCHNPSGTARTSGLDLSLAQKKPAKYGIFKSPVAAGRGSGGRGYDIVPGKPEDSILLYRIESEEPSIRMPSLSRTMAHPESIELIREWIASMPEQE